jgi:hypothetical protein
MTKRELQPPSVTFVKIRTPMECKGEARNNGSPKINPQEIRMIGKVKTGLAFAALAAAFAFQAPLRAQESSQQDKMQSDTMKQDSTKQDKMQDDSMKQDKMPDKMGDKKKKSKKDKKKHEKMGNMKDDKMEDKKNPS